MTDECSTELDTADACIQESGEEECGCYDQPFKETFPNTVLEEYDTIITAYDSSDPEYCTLINTDICGFIEERASCCCLQEVISYNLCIYAKVIVAKYDTNEESPFECTDGGTCSIEANSEGDDDSGDGGGGTINGLKDKAMNLDDDMVIYGIVISIILSLILCGLCYCCDRRRRRRVRIQKNGQGGVQVNVKLDSKNHTNTTSNTEKNTSTTQENITSKKQKSRRKIKDEPSIPYTIDDDTTKHSYDWNQWELTKRSERRKIVDDDETDDVDVESQITMTTMETETLTTTKKKSKKSKKSTKKKKVKEKKSKKRSKYRDDDDDYDDYDYYDDETYYTTEESTRYTTEYIPRRRVEESMRAGRTILEEIDDEDCGNETRKQKHIIAMMPNLQEIIDLLEQEKRLLTEKMKQAEEQKITMQHELEVDAKKRQALEGEYGQAQHQLTKAKLNKELVKSASEANLMATIEEDDDDDDDEAEEEDDFFEVQKMKAMTEEMADLLEDLQQVQKDAEKEAEAKEAEVRLLKTQRSLSAKNLMEMESALEEESIFVQQAEMRTAVLGGQLNENLSSNDGSRSRNSSSSSKKSRKPSRRRSGSTSSSSGSCSDYWSDENSNVEEEDAETLMMMQRVEELKARKRRAENQLNTSKHHPHTSSRTQQQQQQQQDDTLADMLRRQNSAKSLFDLQRQQRQQQQQQLQQQQYIQQQQQAMAMAHQQQHYGGGGGGAPQREGSFAYPEDWYASPQKSNTRVVDLQSNRPDSPGFGMYCDIEGQ